MGSNPLNFSSVVLFSILSSATLGNNVEELLKHYEPVLAKKTSELIKAYKESKNTSPEAMTNVASTMFLMYGLNPNDVTASYGGTESKAVLDNNDGKVRICVAERRDQNLEHHEKAYGNDTFMHEMLHALAFKWYVNGLIKDCGISHSNSEGKVYFERCRKILVSAVYEVEEKERLFKQKFDDLMGNDKLFSGDEEQVQKYLILKYTEYRSRIAKTYSQAKRYPPFLAIQKIHNLGLPLDAEYVEGYLDGKQMWMVKIHDGSGIKKYKPDMEEQYHDDVVRAIDKQIKMIHDELKAVKKGEYSKEKIIEFLNAVRFEKFIKLYWYPFIKNQNIEMELPGL
jgi:hypothetical protein